MSKQTINVGSAPNDGLGDPARTAFTKCNDNFTELYAGTNPDLTTQNAMGALVVDTSKRVNTKTISVDSTLTFNGAPAAGTRFSLLLTNSDGSNPCTITIPNSYSVLRKATVTSVGIANAATIELSWFYTGSTYILESEPIGIVPAAGLFSFVIGIGAGITGGGDFNTLVGRGAGASVPSLGQTVAIGEGAGSNAGGYAGTFAGYLAGNAGGGTSAVGIGHSALRTADTGGTGNVAIGVHAAETVTTSGGMISIGYHSFNGAGTTTNSVAIGDHCGNGVANALNCIFIGPYMGVSRNNTLHIGVSASIGGTAPLIYGEFDNTYAKVNGHLETTQGIKFPSADPHIAGYWWDNAGVLTKSSG